MWATVRDMERKVENKELVVRIPNDLHAQVKQRAEQEDRTIAATIRVALKQYLGIEAAI